MFRFAGLCAAVVLCGLFTSPASAAPRTLNEYARADQATLEALYRGSDTVSVPTGFVPGRAIPSPGSRNTLRRSNVIGLLWKGKVFDGSRAIMIDQMLGPDLGVGAKLRLEPLSTTLHRYGWLGRDPHRSTPQRSGFAGRGGDHRRGAQGAGVPECGHWQMAKRQAAIRRA